MTDTAGIVKKANEIVQICGTRDPHRIAQMLGITVMPYPFEKQKGAYKVIMRNRFIFIKQDLHPVKAKRIRDNSKTIIHTSSSGKKGITVTLGKSPVWPFFCFCIKQGRTGGVTHRYGPFFISGNRAYLSVARNSDTSAVVMSKYITRFSASNSPVTLYRFFGS